mgnify:CR=1 FL=1
MVVKLNECLSSQTSELAERDVQITNINIDILRDKTASKPQWVHFGGGNLYRGFHAEVAQELINQGKLETGVVVCETYDENIIDEAYLPYDNAILEVIMHEDGKLEKNYCNRLQQLIIATLVALKVMRRSKLSLKMLVCNLRLSQSLKKGIA